MTARRRKQSIANLLLGPEFPANRERYWEFRFGVGLVSEITTALPAL